MSKFNPFLFASLLLTVIAHAFDGGDSSGGGDLNRLSRERANSEAPLSFDKEFKNEIARYFEWIKQELPSVQDKRLKTVFQVMTTPRTTPITKDPSENNPAVKDVWDSEYKLSEFCYDLNDVPKSAASQILKPATPICLSQSLLTEQRPSKKELLALLVHEHIVHFHGLSDEDHSIMQWVMDNAPKFYFATTKFSTDGCTENLFIEKYNTGDATMLLGFTALGIAGVGIGIHDFRSHDPEVSPSVGVIGGAMAIASGVSYGLSRIKEHKRQKSFVNSVRIIKEAGELEIKPNGILELLYKKLVLNSKDQSLKTHVTPRLFSNIILEANQRSTFCPLYNTPMTSQQIEEWIKIYLRDKAPQL